MGEGRSGATQQFWSDGDQPAGQGPDCQQASPLSRHRSDTALTSSLIDLVTEQTVERVR